MLETRPLSTETWPDLERLFGRRGACGGCWCMHWRLTNKEYEAGKGEQNRRALGQLSTTAPAPGLLGYQNQTPVAWVSLAPRNELPRLARSRILKPVDSTPVWSIVCLFIARQARRQGASRAMIDAAVAYARRHGASVVEAYPVEPRKAKMPDLFAFTGIASTFRKAGFVEVARRSETRPIMRIGDAPQ